MQLHTSRSFYGLDKSLQLLDGGANPTTIVPMLKSLLNKCFETLHCFYIMDYFQLIFFFFVEKSKSFERVGLFPKFDHNKSTFVIQKANVIFLKCETQ